MAKSRASRWHVGTMSHLADLPWRSPMRTPGASLRITRSTIFGTCRPGARSGCGSTAILGISIERTFRASRMRSAETTERAHSCPTSHRQWIGSVSASTTGAQTGAQIIANAACEASLASRVLSEAWFDAHWVLLEYATRSALAVALLPLVWRWFEIEDFSQTAPTSFVIMFVPDAVVSEAGIGQLPNV